MKENTEETRRTVRNDFTDPSVCFIAAEKIDGEICPIALIIRHPECPIERFEEFHNTMTKNANK